VFPLWEYSNQCVVGFLGRVRDGAVWIPDSRKYTNRQACAVGKAFENRHNKPPQQSLVSKGSAGSSMNLHRRV
jgi:hypothetical protein